MSRVTQVIVAALACTMAHWAFAGVVVVVSSKNPTGNLSKDQVNDIYLGNSKNFPGGGTAQPVDMADGAAEHDTFHKAVTGKSAAQFKAYWAKMVFSGKGTPPKEVGNSGDMKAAIADHPNMIGYVDKSAVDGTLKIVLELN